MRRLLRPAPVEPDHEYLRVDTAKGQNMDAFCGVCLGEGGSKVVAKKAAIFTSMDQRAAPAAAAPAKK